MEIEKFKNVVEKVLKENPATRDNDNLLYLKTIETIKPGSSNFSMKTILMNLKEYKLPQFETVRRSRQHLQANNKELRGSKINQKARQSLEEEYHDYFSH